MTEELATPVTISRSIFTIGVVHDDAPCPRSGQRDEFVIESTVRRGWIVNYPALNFRCGLCDRSLGAWIVSWEVVP